jgi:hypothetical protein
MQAYRVVAERVLPIFAQRYGLSVESAKAQLDAKVAALVQGTRLYIHADLKALAQILRDGRFKSQIETGTSHGLLIPEERKRTERGLFNYKLDLDPTKRPIYGCLADGPHGQSYGTSHFGSAVIRLKESVRPRVTFTLSDSLMMTKEDELRGYVFGLPVPLEKPSMQALHLTSLLWSLPDKPSRANPLTWRSLRDTGTYTEIQIHGGVLSSAIEDVSLQVSDDLSEDGCKPAWTGDASKGCNSRVSASSSGSDDQAISSALDPASEIVSNLFTPFPTDTLDVERLLKW